MPTLMTRTLPGFGPPSGFPTPINSFSGNQVFLATSSTARFEKTLILRNAASIAKFLSTANLIPPAASSSTVNASQPRGQNTKSLKIILISVGVVATAIIGLLVVILLVYCRRRKRRLSGNDNRIANPFTEASPSTPASQPPDSLEIAKKYIDVLENQIEKMRREVASATTTEQSRAGPSTLGAPTFGEPERVAPPPQYELV